MICTRCLLRAAPRASPLPTTTTTTRALTTTPRRLSPPDTVTANQTTTTTPRPHDLPAATSVPSVTQPFSTPLTPTPDAQKPSPPRGGSGKAKTPAKVVSSVPEGTVLKGLNFVKGKQDPVAKADGEYPAWLWGVLEQVRKGGEGEGVGDLFSKSKKQRRKAAKALKRQQERDPEALVPKIPLFEQTVDLPGGEGAGEAREELRASMREERRRTIKEENFLKAMG